MKKLMKTAGCCFVVLFFSICMFICLVSGAPDEGEGLRRYLIFAALFSIGVPAFTGFCIAYIFRLQKRIESLEEQLRSRDVKIHLGNDCSARNR